MFQIRAKVLYAYMVSEAYGRFLPQVDSGFMNKKISGRWLD